MNKGKKQSFRSQLKKANIIMTVLIIVFLVVFNISNKNVVNKFNNSFQSYNQLSLYYDHVLQAHSSMKDYLYSENKNAFSEYKSYIEKADENIENLTNKSDVDQSWRFDLLSNMLYEYKEACNQLLVDLNVSVEEYNRKYNVIESTQHLIANTSGQYYKLITDSMSSQKDQLNRIQNGTIFATMALISILLFWLIFYSHQITTAITKPIGLLIQNINKVKEGRYDLTQISNASLEMEALCSELVDMALKVQENIETSKQKIVLEKQLLEIENENLKKDELLAQSELRMLQNQINPHFLFNTLNMIYRLAIRDGAQDAGDMLEKTSQLLRYGLDKQNRLSDIASECESIQNYIDIQTRRLGKRVKFQLIVDDIEKYKDVSIPGMILQPLVENSLKHGLNDVMSDGEVTIEVKSVDGLIDLSVSDNGKGMSSAQLDELILNDYHKDDDEIHLGLFNVVRRLEMFYRDQVSISINSEEDCGFEMIIQIKS
ncbi:MAG: histidine kinase [Erysipelotrichaceae bacterium]